MIGAMAVGAEREKPAPHRSKAGYAAPAELPMVALDDHGMIRHCSPACEDLFGYRLDELAGRHISTLVPQMDGALVHENRINAWVAFLCRCAFPFQARRRNGDRFASQLFVNRLGAHNVVVLVRRIETR